MRQPAPAAFLFHPAAGGVWGVSAPATGGGVGESSIILAREGPGLETPGVKKGVKERRKGIEG